MIVFLGFFPPPPLFYKTVYILDYYSFCGKYKNHIVSRYVLFFHNPVEHSECFHFVCSFGISFSIINY